MNRDKIPTALRERNQWVVWKSVVRDGKSTKLPFQTSGAAAKSNDPETWTDFDSAASAMRRGYPGVGFVFSEQDEFCGIDLDGCRDPKSGTLAPWARGILKKLNSYSEVSPSKTGVKVFVLGKSPWGAGKKFPAKDAEKICDKEPAIEVYDRLRYFAVTSERLAGVSPNIEPRQSELEWLAREFGPAETPATRIDWQSDDAVSERARKYLAKVPVSVSGQGGHNAAFHAACLLVIDFGLTEGQAFGLLSEWNVGCQPPWSEKDLRRKVSEAQKQPGERNRLRNAREESWQHVKIAEYKPQDSSLPDVRRTTLEEASFARIELIEKHADNLLDLSLPDLDYSLGGGVEQGEMIILAARPSHGKSAVALQIVHHFTNQGYPTLIVSEEMSALALAKRTIQFASDIPKEHWRTSSQKLRQDMTDHFSSRAPCLIVESCKSVYRAAEEIRMAAKDDGVKLAVVDYAQLLVGRGKGRYEQITETSMVLKQVTTETRVVLVALCQLSRAIESRKGAFVPQLSDLKDSGQLEQDADVIVFLVWPHKIDSRNDPSEYQFFVAKNRNREINCHAFKCIFKPARQMLIAEKAPVATEWNPEESFDDSRDYTWR